VCDVLTHLATYSRVTTTRGTGYVRHAQDVTRVAPGCRLVMRLERDAAGAALPEEDGPCCVVRWCW
jgi:hypothetical protein